MLSAIIVGILGMVYGSYLFVLASKFADGTVCTWGQWGKITLAERVGTSSGVFIAIAIPLLIVLSEVFHNGVL